MFNLQRSCEAIIDLILYVISTRQLGLPQNKRQAVTILEENHIIDENMSKKLKGMIGFRNIAVHDYQEIDKNILIDVIENHLNDLIDFARIILNLK